MLIYNRDMEINEDIFKLIKILTRSVVNDSKIESEYNGDCLVMGNTKYILNQTLRQMTLPDDNIYISNKAYELWQKISPKNYDIREVNYKQKVICENDEPIKVKVYKGSNSTPEKEELTLQKGVEFVYNDVFHEDHIIPVSQIIKKLCELEKANKLTNENILKILNSITICKMLKSEDRDIHERSKRPQSTDEIIDRIYGSKVQIRRLIDIENEKTL